MPKSIASHRSSSSTFWSGGDWGTSGRPVPTESPRATRSVERQPDELRAPGRQRRWRGSLGRQRQPQLSRCARLIVAVGGRRARASSPSSANWYVGPACPGHRRNGWPTDTGSMVPHRSGSAARTITRHRLERRKRHAGVPKRSQPTNEATRSARCTGLRRQTAPQIPWQWIASARLRLGRQQAELVEVAVSDAAAHTTLDLADAGLGQLPA